MLYSYYTVLEKLLVYLMKQSFFEFFMLEEWSYYRENIPF